MSETFTFILASIGPLLFAALITRFLPLPLRTFQAVYLISGAAWVLAHYTFLPNVWIGWPIIILVIGEIVQLLAIGVIGARLGPSNYASILLMVGLFPWYLGFGVAFSYVLFFLAFTAVVSTVRFRLALKNAGIKPGVVKSPEAVMAKLQGGELERFRKTASVMFSMPAALSALAVMVFTSIM